MILSFLVGVTLLNGMPHFTAGSAGQVFRSPFNRHTAPRINVLYGLGNFVTAVVLVVVRGVLGPVTVLDLVALLIGAVVVIAYFGVAARWFFDDRPLDSASGASSRAETQP